MRIAVAERDLMWSVKVKNALKAGGHEPVEPGDPGAEAAIVNLGLPDAQLQATLELLKGIPVIGHAGHKETELLELGQRLGLKAVVSNSTVANRLVETLAKVLATP